MDTGSQTLRIWLIRIGFALWALAGIALVSCGAFLFAMALDKWIEDGFDFVGWSIFDWLVGLIGAGMIHFGLLLAGLFFRFIDWPPSHRGSLVVVAVSVPYILLAFAMLDSPFRQANGAEHYLMLAAGLCSFFVLTVPPYLHWQAQRRAVPAKSKT